MSVKDIFITTNELADFFKENVGMYERVKNTWIFKPIKNKKEMETIEIKIPNGCKLVKTCAGEKIIYTVEPLGIDDLPDKWEDLDFISGYFINSDSKIVDQGESLRTQEHNKNVYSDLKFAQAALAQAQITQLMKVYNGDWKPDWSIKDRKYIIEMSEVSNDKQMSISKGIAFHIPRFLAFKTEELRDTFFNKHHDLLRIMMPFL